ncbi:MAG: DUF1194 domain-containing protein [Pseudomonadota bacterium]
MALILAVDVSGSVDSREYAIQMQGLAEGLRDGAVSEALVAHQAQVQLIQWTGSGRQQVSVDWTALEGGADVATFADQVETAPRAWRNFSTAIGEALVFAQGNFAKVLHCARKVIDVSGDGPSNEGVAPEAVHAQLDAQGIIVNGLAIEESDAALTRYYEQKLITGPGAFAIRAARFEDYPDRIRRKLLREITKQLSSAGSSKQNDNL